ncbi:MAG: hypothetical protein CMF58_00905 [Lentimicrobiaceae bacterium]|nr:hypothetical protein [Lentimicrobiaceae bacterium]
MIKHLVFSITLEFIFLAYLSNRMPICLFIRYYGLKCIFNDTMSELNTKTVQRYKLKNVKWNKNLVKIYYFCTYKSGCGAVG